MAAAIDPAIHGATPVREQPDPLLIAELEAWILTGEPTDDRRRWCDLCRADLIEAYERAFFHVRDRLECRDYILVCRPGIDAVEHLKIEDRAPYGRSLLIFRGRYVLEAMIQAFPWSPTTALARIAANRSRRTIKTHQLVQARGPGFVSGHR